MSFPGPVADYLDALARELAFDPALSRRVRAEIEDHLQEAIAADTIESPVGTETRAIARLGSPREIAAPYKAISLHRRAKRTGIGILCTILVAFVAMDSRVAWYGFMQWQSSHRLALAGQTLVPIDRYAFLIALCFGIVGSIYTFSRPIAAACTPDFRRQLRFGQFLIAAATGAVAIAVMSEVVLTAWRLIEASWTAAALFPAASLIGEVGALVAAVLYLCRTIYRAAAILSHEAGA